MFVRTTLVVGVSNVHHSSRRLTSPSCAANAMANVTSVDASAPVPSSAIAGTPVPTISVLSPSTVSAT